MSINKVIAIIFALGALLLAGCAGSTNAEAAKPDRSPDTLKIVMHPVINTQPTTVTISNAQKVQQLYKAIYNLPPLAIDRMCTAQARTRYDLTFSKGGQVVLSAGADASGCGVVILSKNDQRQPDESFWKLVQNLQSASPQTLSLSAADNGATLQLRIGDKIEIALDSNPTTGYGWDIDKSDISLLTPTQSKYTSSSNLVGAGGTQTFTFKAIGTGTVNLQLKYWRSFEGPKSIIQRFAVTVQIQA